MKIRAYAALQESGLLEPFEFELGSLKSDEVEIGVEYCSICRGDLSMLKNEWGITQFPIVPGHEVVGRITAVGDTVMHLNVGQYVGLGCRARSCLTCEQCLSGNHNRCLNGEEVYLGRHGGFADKVRCQAVWAFPLPTGTNPSTAGPLFCGGVTVFSAIMQNSVKPIDHIAVVGIGGLGHMAIKFLNSWGCEITAFSTTPEKENEARKFGAHHFVLTSDTDMLHPPANSYDMVLVTTDAELDWGAYINSLRPGGKLHILGADAQVKAFSYHLVSGDKSIGGSYIGSPSTYSTMLSYCNRHRIEPMTEEYPLSRVNEAMTRLESGKAHYRIVLRNDL